MSTKSTKSVSLTLTLPSSTTSLVGSVGARIQTVSPLKFDNFYQLTNKSLAHDSRCVVKECIERKTGRKYKKIKFKNFIE